MINGINLNSSKNLLSLKFLYLVMMEQMQEQQGALHKLIQEHRENNADKLMQENSELQQRLLMLELDEMKFQKESEGYSTMPLRNGEF